MVEEISLKPMGRDEIHKLETALLLGTLFSSKVLELLKNPDERLTWVDSLAVAAGAIAREKAGMTVSQIAEDLGRSEATIRNHLKGKTKAGELVTETYNRFVKEGVKIEFENVSELREKIQAIKEKLKDVIEELDKI